MTAAIAAAVAGLAEPGDVVVLSGGLGAGKTAFVKGFAAALGVVDEVTSPTFTLVRSYRTSSGWEMLHADLYRLERLDEVRDLGLAEAADYGAVVLVEWGERGLAALPPGYLSLAFETTGTTTRTLSVASAGGGWAARARALAAVVSAAAEAPR